MVHKSVVLTLIAAVTLGGCQDSNGPISGPDTTSPIGGSANFDPVPSGGTSQSVHYFGVYLTDSLPGVGPVEINYTGCDGFVVGTYATGGRCIEILVDGSFTMVDRVEYGSIIKLDYPIFGTATVDVQHAVIGPVELVDADRARLVVLGQIVPRT